MTTFIKDFFMCVAYYVQAKKEKQTNKQTNIDFNESIWKYIV